MTTHPEEDDCECHWGSQEDLALLKLPDAELSPDLLRRTWNAPDWSDHGAVLRRVLPQFTRDLVSGRVEPMSGMYEVGRSFARGHWRQWPAPQSAAIWEFLHAWWAHSLVDPAPPVPVLGDQLPWDPWDNEADHQRHELASWLARHAPTRLHAPKVPETLLHRIRLIGLTGPARWEDPHWPGHRY
ncbi:hypothetical protein [Streptomyces microflavus]|uniref:hypothetical protein n=1 Tax=Streptomyces microflavus TaxID=1919 RepID=UPI0036AAAE27